MKFHILSDLHLEYHQEINSLESFIKKFPYIMEDITEDIKENTIHLDDTILILAGDIGYPTSSNYFEFLSSCCKYYKDVIFVSGNHEYYHSDFETINNLLIKESSNISNLHFLLNNSIIIDNYKFIGTTLWTNVDKYTKERVGTSMNDYVFIKNKENDNNFISVNDTNDLHKKQLDYIEEELSKEENKYINIVITHHLPSKKLISKKYIQYGSLNKAFYTDCEYLFHKYNIKTWICGHSHTKMNDVINNTQLILNPFGYKNENTSSKILKIFL
jgi:predicted phosphohydrolase